MAEKPSSFSADVPHSSYPGERLGLPEEGPGSIGDYGPRLLGLVIDWGLAALLSWWLFDYNPIAQQLLFFGLTALFIILFGGSLGHMIMGMRLNTVTGSAPGLWRPILRQALLSLVLPALFIDEDRRGGHDVLSGLVLRKFR